VSLRKKSFRGATTHRYVAGGDAKLVVAQPIIKALNAHYGGDNWPNPPSSMLYGKYYKPPVSTTPATPAAPSTGGGQAPPAGGQSTPAPQTTQAPPAAPAPTAPAP
jgi:hypothetical protein